jgi:hypothetical protein
VVAVNEIQMRSMLVALTDVYADRAINPIRIESLQERRVMCLAHSSILCLLLVDPLFTSLFREEALFENLI